MSAVVLAGCLQESSEGLAFAIRGLAAEAELVAALQSLFVAGCRLGEQALAERPGGFGEGFCVERGQGLQGRIADSAFDVGEVGIRAVEGGEVRMRGGAFEESVEPAAETILPGAGQPFEIVGVAEIRNVWRHRRENAGATDLAA